MYYSPNIALFFGFVRDIIITTTMLSFNVIKYTGLGERVLRGRAAPPNFYKLAIFGKVTSLYMEIRTSSVGKITNLSANYTLS
jgi:hypothetical protein